MRGRLDARRDARCAARRPAAVPRGAYVHHAPGHDRAHRCATCHRLRYCRTCGRCGACRAATAAPVGGAN